MGPSSLQVYEKGTPLLRRIMASAQHFLIDQSLFETATSIQHDTTTNEAIWAFDAALPADHCVVEFETSGVVILSKGVASDVDVRMPGFLPPESWDHPVASYNRGVFGPHDEACTIHKALPRDKVDPHLVLRGVHTLDIIFSLIAEPRLTTLQPPSRPMRRRAQRVFQGVVPAWNVVKWRVDAPTTPKNADPMPGTRMPLHYCRAHWMRGQEGWPKAEQRPGKEGWWVWRRHSWKGHPDFGVKLHRYRPVIGSASGAREKSKPKIEIAGEIALEAMQAAGQSATREWEHRDQ